MDYSKLIETYSLEELLEYNDITQEEALTVLIKYFPSLEFPPLPIDCYAPTE